MEYYGLHSEINEYLQNWINSFFDSPPPLALFSIQEKERLLKEKSFPFISIELKSKKFLELKPTRFVEDNIEKQVLSSPVKGKGFFICPLTIEIYGEKTKQMELDKQATGLLISCSYQHFSDFAGYSKNQVSPLSYSWSELSSDPDIIIYTLEIEIKKALVHKREISFQELKNAFPKGDF